MGLLFSSPCAFPPQPPLSLLTAPLVSCPAPCAATPAAQSGKQWGSSGHVHPCSAHKHDTASPRLPLPSHHSHCHSTQPSLTRVTAADVQGAEKARSRRQGETVLEADIGLTSTVGPAQPVCPLNALSPCHDSHMSCADRGPVCLLAVLHRACDVSNGSVPHSLQHWRSVRLRVGQTDFVPAPQRPHMRCWLLLRRPTLTRAARSVVAAATDVSSRTD